MDFITNQNPTEYNYLKTLLPEIDFSKAATASNVDSLRDSAFAGNREFPISGGANVLASKAYVEAYPGQVDMSITDMIETAAGFHGVKEAHDQIAKVASSLRVKIATSATPEPEYALQVSDGPKLYRAYPLNDAEDVRDSSVKLANDRHKMTLDWFIDASRAVVKKAEVLKVPMDALPKAITHYGEPREVNLKYASVALNDRLRRVSDQDGEIYTELWESAKEASSKDERDELLNLVLDLDHATGLHDHRDVEDPYTCFYSDIPTKSLDKVAGTHICAEDVIIPVGSFNRIPADILVREFSAKTATQLIDLQNKAKDNEGDIALMGKIASTFDSFEPGVRAELYGIILDADTAVR